MVRFLGYPKCSTCQKAKKYLKDKDHSIDEQDITVRPPEKKLIEDLLAAGYTLPELFNRSGEMYRELNMKEKMKTLKESELIQLLVKHGKLVKRPIITDGKKHTVGFDESEMKKVWG